MSARHAPLLLLLLVLSRARAAGGEDHDPAVTVRRWARHHAIPPLAADGRLTQVAQLSSFALSEVGGRAPSHSTAYLRFLLEQAGVVDAMVLAEARVLEATDTPASQLLGLLEQRAVTSGSTHYGVAVSRAGPDQPEVLTLVLVRRLVELTRGGLPSRLCGRLLRGRHPSLLVTLPQGRLFQRGWPGLGRGDRFCADLPTRSIGLYQVEIMVDGPHGPEVAALFPLRIGLAPPELPEHTLYPAPRGDRHVEIQLMDLVNAARRTAGLALLQPSAALARLARAHSDDMVHSGYFGHISPTQGSLDRRLAQAGLSYRSASENLAVATSPFRAHDSLMSSPSHRSTLLDPGLTLLGVGVARDPERGVLYITQILARDDS